MKCKLFFLLIIVSMCSCKNQNDIAMEKQEIEEFSLCPYCHTTEEENLIQLMREKGDTSAYLKFFIYHADDGVADMCLTYSLLMANEYHYHQACLDVFDVLSQKYGFEYGSDTYSFYQLDPYIQDFALHHFKLAIKYGNKEASIRLLEKYGPNCSYPIKELYNDKELVSTAMSNLKSIVLHEP